MKKEPKTVLVTGATGYIASWIVKFLLEDGHTVHAAIRDKKNKTKTKHLSEIASKSKGVPQEFRIKSSGTTTPLLTCFSASLLSFVG